MNRLLRGGGTGDGESMFLELGPLLLFKHRSPRSEHTSLPSSEYCVYQLQLCLFLCKDDSFTQQQLKAAFVYFLAMTTSCLMQIVAPVFHVHAERLGCDELHKQKLSPQPH